MPDAQSRLRANGIPQLQIVRAEHRPGDRVLTGDACYKVREDGGYEPHRYEYPAPHGMGPRHLDDWWGILLLLASAVVSLTLGYVGLHGLGIL